MPFLKSAQLKKGTSPGCPHKPYPAPSRSSLSGKAAGIFDPLSNLRRKPVSYWKKGVRKWIRSEQLSAEKPTWSWAAPPSGSPSHCQLWVAECQLLRGLTTKEMDTLKQYITGQASDGWGEGFEQRVIRVAEESLNVHMWNNDEWSLKRSWRRSTTTTIATR